MRYLTLGLFLSCGGDAGPGADAGVPSYDAREACNYLEGAYFRSVRKYCDGDFVPIGCVNVARDAVVSVSDYERCDRAIRITTCNAGWPSPACDFLFELPIQ